MNTGIFRSFSLAAILAVQATGAFAQFTFTLAGDNTTSDPRVPSQLMFDYQTPSISAGKIAFYGYGFGPAVFAGVPPTYSVFVDFNTTSPDTISSYNPFSTYPQPIIDEAGRIAMVALTGAHGYAELYQESGVLKLGPATFPGQTIPNGTGNFNTLRMPWISNGVLALYGDGSSSQGGIYTSSSLGLTRIVDKATTFPGTGSSLFESFYTRPGIANGTVMFLGSAQSATLFGVFTAPATGGSLTTVAQSGDALPGSAFTLGTLPLARSSNSGVTFYATAQTSSSFTGLYTNVGGPLTKIMDTSTLIPGSATATYTALPGGITSPLGMDAGQVVFLAGDTESSNLAIYYWKSGTVTRVIKKGDTLGGKTVTSLDMGPQPISGNKIAFKATLSNSPSDIQSIWIATIPGAAVEEWSHYE
ncbi:MAG: hypothetical protein K1X53_01410 [Candidatus Sumerlaeaceae bacterium]|nr:hypothetical protein [Candidatus Sumerlaeaceae bacterium]